MEGRSVSRSTGGVDPIWSRDGTELYYREGRQMMAVVFEPGAQLAFQTPVVLFTGDYGYSGQAPSYDVHSDGRFLMIERDVVASSINIVLNWFEELKRLVPTGRQQ